MGGMGEAGPGLAGVVVKLHQAEDQVCWHELKLVWRVGDDVPGQGRQRGHTQEDNRVETTPLSEPKGSSGVSEDLEDGLLAGSRL